MAQKKAMKRATKQGTKQAPRARTARRAHLRELGKTTDKLGRLAKELPGARPETALTVSSAAVVETKARTHRCVFCEGELELRDHRAATLKGEILREVILLCRLCHAPRHLFFRVLPPLPS